MCKRTHKFSEREMASFGKGHAVGCEEGRAIGKVDLVRYLIENRICLFSADEGKASSYQLAISDDMTDTQIIEELKKAGRDKTHVLSGANTVVQQEG